MLSIDEFLSEIGSGPGSFTVDWQKGFQGYPWGEFIVGYVRGFIDGAGRKWLIIGRVAWDNDDNAPIKGFDDAVRLLADDELKRRMMNLLNDFLEYQGFSVRQDILREVIEHNDINALKNIIRRV